MEAHPCEKESFLDKVWRYINEIVSDLFLTQTNFFLSEIIGLRGTSETGKVHLRISNCGGICVFCISIRYAIFLSLYFNPTWMGHTPLVCK